MRVRVRVLARKYCLTWVAKEVPTWDPAAVAVRTMMCVRRRLLTVLLARRWTRLPRGMAPVRLLVLLPVSGLMRRWVVGAVAPLWPMAVAATMARRHPILS